MKSIKSLVSAIGAAAVVLSATQAAQASWLLPDEVDVDFAIDHITAELTQLVAMACVKADNVKAVYLEDILSGPDLADANADLKDFNTQLEIISLKNTLNNMKVLDGANITAFKDFLYANDFDINDAVGLEVFRDGRVVILGCGEAFK